MFSDCLISLSPLYSTEGEGGGPALLLTLAMGGSYSSVWSI